MDATLFAPLLFASLGAWCLIGVVIESRRNDAADRAAVREARLRKTHKRHLVSALVDAGSIRKEVR